MGRAGPDFLCIGAQKAGTTWLHENLIQCPDIWLPPVKELHVFDHRPPSLAKRFWGKASHHKLAREHLRSTLLARTAGLDDRALAWHIAFGKRDWNWYEDLFTYAGERTAGEICPGYARLDGSKISEIAARYPKLKIIYLLRDPVDRAWSSVAMHYRKDGAGLVTDRSREEILLRLRTRSSSPIACTAETSRNGPGISPKIRSTSASSIASVLNHRPIFRRYCGFLGFLAALHPETLGFVNQGKGERMPADIEIDFATQLLPEAEYLHRRFSNAYTARWMEHARAAAGGKQG